MFKKITVVGENLYEYPKWNFKAGAVLYKAKYYKYYVKPYQAIKK